LKEVLEKWSPIRKQDGFKKLVQWTFPCHIIVKMEVDLFKEDFGKCQKNTLLPENGK